MADAQLQLVKEKMTDPIAEEKLIAISVRSPQLISQLLARGLRAEQFSDLSHRKVFEVLTTMHEAGVPIDKLLLMDELKRMNRFIWIGGPDYLISLDSVRHVDHPESYASIVKEHWARRTLVSGLGSIAAKASDQSSEKTRVEVATLIDGSKTLDLASALKRQGDVCKTLNERMKLGPVPAISTGLETLDRATKGGLKKGQLTVLAAQTSVGKSAFAIQIAHSAAQAGKKVLYVSLEMSAEEISEDRLMLRYRGIHPRKTNDELLDEIRKLPITYVDRRGLTIANIRALAQLVAASNGLDLLIVDYLTLIEHPGANAFAKASGISKALMDLPVELGVPVLALSQLNRENSRSKDKSTTNPGKMEVPSISHLRDSGTIEQDAHNVWLLHREYRNSYNADLIVGKQRGGKIGAVHLTYQLESQIFTERASEPVRPQRHYDDSEAEPDIDGGMF